MQLVGMLDSPYVRRVALSLRYLAIPFELSEISVFRSMDAFSKVNPLLKAPSFVCDDGEVLMDSTLILNYAKRIADNGKTLMPEAIADYQTAIRLIGLGLNACDKSVQIEYERKRPNDKQYQPWRDRIQSQLVAAYDLIEPYAADTDDWLVGGQLSQADITVGVAWQFTQFLMPDVINVHSYPAVSVLSQRLEARPEFMAIPIEPGWIAKV
ncbi:MAG: glutathione S-transferase [Leptolyngbya foveolarum]|uniref:Glutathione S-transferase n=1 Tax=Leptolyngbya foveolarum TaxID=47253 RepID=A0A2W4UPM6_9CYAN|nr:MAG: glutathione S-transferase [Leptolyngbya foveolarum]